jgi:hypothetical protein
VIKNTDAFSTCDAKSPPRGENAVSCTTPPKSLPHLPVSPLTLSDRLLSLAQDADRAGFAGTAERLLTLAHSVFDETPTTPDWAEAPTQWRGVPAPFR